MYKDPVLATSKMLTIEVLLPTILTINLLHTLCHYNYKLTALNNYSLLFSAMR